jgi:outer membrane lipoprotein carrier protein
MINLRPVLFWMFCFVVISATSASAAALSPVEGLEAFRRAFAGIRDFSADIAQEKQLTLMKKKLTANGTVRFRKPDSFFMELHSPSASRVLLKDNTLSLKLPNEAERQNMVLPAEQGLSRWFAFLARPVKSIPGGFDVRAEKRGTVLSLRILPKTKGALKELLVVFREDGRLVRLVIEENNGDRTVIGFRNVKKNTGLTDKDFQL